MVNEKANVQVTLNSQEAQHQLEELQGEMKRLIELKRKAEEAGDVDGYKKINAEIKKVTRSANKLVAEHRYIEKTLNNLNGASFNELKGAEIALIKQTRKLNRQTDEYTKKRAQLKLVKNELNKINAEYRQQNGLLKSLKTFLPVISFTALIAGARRAITEFAHFDDTLADAIKTTGLTRREITLLNKDLQKLNTRSSQEELLGLVRIGGKLGITGRKDLLGFAAAADKINVSLNEDLGGNVEETLRKVGKLVDIFGLKEKYGIEDALLRVGSVINQVGATSTANEEYLVNFTERLAGFAPNANLAISDVIGLGSVLDQMGQKAEVSTTVIGKLLVGIGDEIPKYANIANMSIKEFSDLLRDDANEALVRVLEGAKNSTGGLQGMSETLKTLGIDGQRSATVLGVLTANTDLLRKEQDKANAEFESGSSILTEFANKNDTVQARLEKLGKWFKNQFLNVLNEVNEGLKSSTTRFQEQLSEVKNLQTNLSPLIDEYETLQGKTELSANEQARIKTLITDIAAIAPEAITQFDQYGNAISISADKAREFIETQQALLKYQNREAIEETNKTLEKQRAKREKLEEQILSGTKSMTVQTSSFGTSMTQTVALTSEEISNLNAELKSTGDQIKQNELLLNGLKGDYMDLPPAPGSETSPEKGTRKTVGNTVFEWNGTEWIIVQTLGNQSGKAFTEEKEEPLQVEGWMTDNKWDTYGAEELAARKASEEEWTEFLTEQIEKRTLAEAKALDIEKEIAEARIALKDIQINAIGQLAGALAGMFEQGSAAQIAMIAIEKGIAIAQIWMNLAKEKSLINVAAAQMATIPFVGPAMAASYSAAMTAKAIAAAKINTGLIIAQTVASSVSSGKRKKTQAYAKGKYPETTELYTGTYGNKPHLGLFNEVPGQPEMVIDGITNRNLTMNYPEIIRAIYAVRDGRQPQLYAGGKYDQPAGTDSNPTQPYTTGIDKETAVELTQALKAFTNKKLIVYTELIKKDLELLDEIENTSGL